MLPLNKRATCDTDTTKEWWETKFRFRNSTLENCELIPEGEQMQEKWIQKSRVTGFWVLNSELLLEKPKTVLKLLQASMI